MYKNTTALISGAQPVLAAQVLELQLITGYVLCGGKVSMSDIGDLDVIERGWRESWSDDHMSESGDP
jgi:hypothetical protein